MTVSSVQWVTRSVGGKEAHAKSAKNAKNAKRIVLLAILASLTPFA
jgi:hypothetical protein